MGQMTLGGNWRGAAVAFRNCTRGSGSLCSAGFTAYFHSRLIGLGWPTLSGGGEKQAEVAIVSGWLLDCGANGDLYTARGE